DICPKGLIATWERYFSRGAPELGVAVLVPPARLREDAWRTVTGRRHVLLTNYEQLRTPPEILRRTPPDLIVTDEAHRLRRSGAQVTSGVFELRPKRFWALTGTPLERDLEDMATLLSLVAPNRFAPTDAKLHPSSLRSRAKPYVLRRRKKEVLQELPPVLDTVETLELSEAQGRSYRAAVNEYRRSDEKGVELALLTKLQMLCDIDPDSRGSCKVDRILYLLGRILEQDEKAVVFSYRLEPLRELQTRIAKRWGQESAELLLGEMDSDERNHAVTRFRDDKRVLALLASSRVGGEGLTLVEANHVFLFNQWWNPSANDQARDRVVRIGQRRKVRIYRFCCRGTIEEVLERILETKRELFNNVVERLAHGEDAIWHQVLSEVGISRLLSDQVTDPIRHGS
ncbi:MAG: DEAD/DEAH box helicase, partial [Gemmatimonadetes bacterium]|nr:DEAD/DEAH box helicase [Gemmatimonadota bacterium]